MAPLPPIDPPPGMRSLMRSWPRRRISPRSGGGPLPCGLLPHGLLPPDPRLPHGPPPPPLWLLQGIACRPQDAKRPTAGPAGSWRLWVGFCPPVKAARWGSADNSSTACGASAPLEIHESERMLVIRPCRMVAASRLPESGAIEIREHGIALRSRMDLGEVDPADLRQGERVDLGAARNRHRVGSHALCERLARLDGLWPTQRDANAFGLKCGIAREHDRLPPRQRPADGLEGLAPHDHRLPPGEIPEAPQIGLEPPEQPVVAPDHAIVGHGDDEDEGGGHGCPRSMRSRIHNANASSDRSPEAKFRNVTTAS